jgi:hypothetical protein
MSYQNSRTSVPSPKPPPTPSPKPAPTPSPTPSPKPAPTPSPTPLHPVHLNLASYYKGTDLQGNAVDTPPCLAPNNLFQCNDKSSYVCADPSQQGAFWRQHCPDAHKHHKHHHHKKDGKGSKGAMIAFWCILGVIIALLVGIIIFSSVTKKSANSVSMVRRRRR